MLTFSRVGFVIETSAKIWFPSLSNKPSTSLNNFKLIYFVKTLCENFTLCIFLRNASWKSVFVDKYKFIGKTKFLMRFWKLCIGIYWHFDYKNTSTFLFEHARECIFEHTLKWGTSWNKLEPPGTCRNELEPPRTSWKKWN